MEQQGTPGALGSNDQLGLVERLRQERRPTRWARGLDVDYPIAWEPHPVCQEAADEIERLRSYQADALRFRTLLRNTGNEWVLAMPGADHKLQITLNCTGCEQYLPDGAVNFPATIRAVLDDEQRIQDSWAEKRA